MNTSAISVKQKGKLAMRAIGTLIFHSLGALFLALMPWKIFMVLSNYPVRLIDPIINEDYIEFYYMIAIMIQGYITSYAALHIAMKIAKNASIRVTTFCFPIIIALNPILILLKNQLSSTQHPLYTRAFLFQITGTIIGSWIVKIQLEKKTEQQSEPTQSSS